MTQIPENSFAFLTTEILEILETMATEANDKAGEYPSKTIAKVRDRIVAFQLAKIAGRITTLNDEIRDADADIQRAYEDDHMSYKLPQVNHRIVDENSRKINRLLFQAHELALSIHWSIKGAFNEMGIYHFEYRPISYLFGKKA